MTQRRTGKQNTHTRVREGAARKLEHERAARTEAEREAILDELAAELDAIPVDPRPQHAMGVRHRRPARPWHRGTK